MSLGGIIVHSNPTLAKRFHAGVIIVLNYCVQEITSSTFLWETLDITIDNNWKYIKIVNLLFPTHVAVTVWKVVCKKHEMSSLSWCMKK